MSAPRTNDFGIKYRKLEIAGTPAANAFLVCSILFFVYLVKRSEKPKTKYTKLEKNE